MKRLLLCVVLPACAATAPADRVAGDTDAVHDTTPTETFDPCTTATWDTVGGPYVMTWCTPCHSAALPPSQRSGAPRGIDLDEEDDVIALRDRVVARALSDPPTMPPTGGPGPEVRERFAVYLDCLAAGASAR